VTGRNADGLPHVPGRDITDAMSSRPDRGSVECRFRMRPGCIAFLFYYMLPSAQILHAHRNRAFAWAYGQMMIVAAIVATGAGLHVAAYFIERKAHIGPLATLLSVAIPVGVFLGSIYALYYYLVRRFDLLHVWLLMGTAAVAAFAVLGALAGVAMAVCLIILMLAPAVTVVGYEMLGHRHQAGALAKEGRGTLH
jgi:Bacterial low temperature requirement A protein (LtrA)